MTRAGTRRPVPALEPVRGRPDCWRIEPVGAMRVPGIVFASPALLATGAPDEAHIQVENVAALPGIVEASCAMPDVHWGYGFPIVGVAATDVDRGGVISPGGAVSTSPVACVCWSRI